MQAQVIISSLLVSVAALTAAPSFAGGIVGNHNLYPVGYSTTQPSVGLTSQQVQSQLAEARRSGDMLAGGESGLTIREINPARFAMQPTVAGATRQQVERETLEAIRTGNYVVGGEFGGKCNELHPAMHAVR